MATKSIPILVFVLAGAILASCSREDTAASRAHENTNWAILTKADLEDDTPGEFKGIWQPSESDVPRIIQEARPYLEKLKKTTSWDFEREKITEILAGWDKYVCQVVGHTKDGKKLVFLNFFPRAEIKGLLEDKTDWRHVYIDTFDGGADYWQAEYDYETKAFVGFSVNGEA